MGKTTSKAAKLAGGGGAVLALGASLLHSAGPAGAATFNVTTNADAGAGSLRQAIIDANAAAGADTITFQAGLGAIALTTGQIAITDDLVIDGTGSPVVGAGNSSRIFYINDAGAVTLSGLTLENGTTASTGGAVRAFRTDLTVIDTSISGSVADWGGGVFVEEGVVAVTDSTFIDNQATDYGGGLAVYESDSVTIDGSTFDDNYARYEGGGGNFDNIASLSITGTTFTDNAARRNGGGFIVDNAATVDVTGSTFTDNYSGSDGGGFHTDEVGVLTLADSTFTGNDADSDGGGFSIVGMYDGTIDISGITATGNSAPNDQGGAGVIQGNEVVDLTIADSTFSGNVGNVGGAITIARVPDSTINIEASTFIGNDAAEYDGEGTRPGVGGGLYLSSNDNSTTVISTSTFDANTADYGGGIALDDAATVTIDSSTISNNEADAGGGITSGGTALTLVNSTVSGNTAQRGGGGVKADAGSVSYVYQEGRVVEPGTVAITHSTITGNTAAYGGGVLLGGYGTVTLDHDLLDGNVASGFVLGAVTEGPYGEAIFVEGGRVVEQGVTPQALDSVTLTNSIVNGTVAGVVVDAGGNQFEVDANLGPLADNGGPTLTHNLLAGSAALDTGDAAFAGDPTTDQRGLPRVSNARVDVGAVEVQVQTPVEPTPPAEPVPAEPTFTG